MKVGEVGEFGLIERIRKAAPQGRGVRAGIGDDAAWLASGGAALLVTADLLIEKVHFDLRWTSFYALGYKTLAVNLSDIAAMGGLPAYLTLSLAIPARFDSKDIEEFYRGVRALALRTDVSVVGGDISRARRFFVSAALIGRAPYKPILRSGARPSDDLYVTGTLGDSALGLKLLKKNAKGRDAAYLIERHNYPAPRLRAGALLAQRRLATAMIDVSDGLLQDLGHICKASGVGAEIREESLPLSPAYRRLSGGDAATALGGGEDYELLFTARPRARKVLERLRTSLGVRVTRIGRCLSARTGIKVLDRRGRARQPSVTGYDHFK
ncbi:MAG TPA: thiamine-phosphate kinase [Candidatus Binatia bacterium]|nr:thiamine-phosphate kinase [Candidatus Binatia bacterium]